MKTFFVTLTSESLGPSLPSVVDHWFFVTPVSGILSPYFDYGSYVDDGSFISLIINGAGTSDSNGVYYFSDNHHFYQVTPSNGYTVSLSGSNWAILDPYNVVQYTTPFVDFYSLTNTWVVSSGIAPSPTAILSSAPDTSVAYVCGGYIFPWGYQVIDQTQFININNGDGLKGDTMVIFCPSAINITYHDVLKIIYNPGNGEDVITINRPILAQTNDNSFDGVLIGNQFGSPIYQNVSFTYRASSQPITYYPSITGLYGDMTRLFYDFVLTIHPNSIYDIDGVHLVGMNQTPSISGGVLSILAVESRDSITGNITIDSK
tara:strand:- start:10203 stop:11156 length:954 start_codon:yes stop_codon:yes gene_type:complete